MTKTWTQLIWFQPLSFCGSAFKNVKGEQSLQIIRNTCEYASIFSPPLLSLPVEILLLICLPWLGKFGNPMDVCSNTVLVEIQDGRGVDGCGAHLSPWIHWQYTSRHWRSYRTPAESRQEYLSTRKKKNRTMQNSVGQRKEGGGGAGGRKVSRTGSVPGAWGNWSRDQILILRQLLGTEVKHLRLLDNEVSVTVQMEWEPHRQSFHSHMYLDRDTSPLESAASGGWSIEIGG